MPLASADDDGELFADGESGGKGSSSSSDEEESEFDFDEEQTQPREPVEPPKEGTKKGGTIRKANRSKRLLNFFISVGVQELGKKNNGRCIRTLPTERPRIV